MNLKDILSRITGISCPIFGVSWNPPEPHRLVARKFIIFLENERVLSASLAEGNITFDYMYISIQKIRNYITKELQLLEENGELSNTLRALRAVCRKLCDSLSKLPHREFDDHAVFMVGEFRGVFGLHLALLAVQYGIEIEDELAAILPGPTDEGEPFYLIEL